MAMAHARWEHFDHGADIGVRGIGPTLASAFEGAAIALAAVSIDPAAIRSTTMIEIACRAPDRELLLVEWLNALIYEGAVRRMAFARFSVAITDGSLRARAWGEPIAPERHQPAVEVKGATLTAIRVAQREDGDFVAQCVVDV